MPRWACCPTVRSAEYWRAQPAWTHEDRSGFLVARDDGGALKGYIRSRTSRSRVEILELGVEPERATCGRQFAAVVTQRRVGKVEAQLPPSLQEVIPSTHRQLAPVSGLMGRTLDALRLFRALEPVLIERARAAGCVGGRLTFAHGSGTTTHTVVEEHSVTLDRQAGAALR